MSRSSYRRICFGAWDGASSVKDGTDALWHWGDNGSFKAFVMADPKTKSAVVIFANSQNGLEAAKPVVAEAMGRGSLAFAWLK